MRSSPDPSTATVGAPPAEAASVRRRVDAARQAAHHDDAARRQIRRQPVGDLEGVRRCRARANDRDRGRASAVDVTPHPEDGRWVGDAARSAGYAGRSTAPGSMPAARAAASAASARGARQLQRHRDASCSGPRTPRARSRARRQASRPIRRSDGRRISLKAAATRERDAGSIETATATKDPCASSPFGGGATSRPHYRRSVSGPRRANGPYEARQTLTKIAGIGVENAGRHGSAVVRRLLEMPCRKPLRRARCGAIVNPSLRMRVPSSRRRGCARRVCPAAHAGDARSDAREQVEFGIKVAQSGLWKEATYRWEKAVEIDPTYAAAWNNLAIAYEHEGQLRQGARGVREGGRARSEESADPAELRSLQRNQ